MPNDMNFDANKVPPNSKPDPVPVDWYTAMITESEVNPVSSGKGKSLKLKHVILAPEAYKGRIVYAQLNIQHESEQAQKIAQGDLSAICHATGQLQLRNSSQLHNIPMQIRVVIKPAKDGYDAKNEIKGWRPIDGAAPAAASSTTAAIPTSAPANVPAWANKKSA